MEKTGLQLSSRYSTAGSLEDLNASVDLLKQVVDATAPTHPQWASRVNNFAIQLGMRYTNTRVIEDINQSTDMLWKVVNFVSVDTDGYITYLNNLGHGLGFKYIATKEPEDLEKTIQVLRKGIQIIPVNDPLWPTCVNNLGMRLGQQYELTSAMEDLEEAVQMSRAAVGATPPYDPDRVRRLHNLGLSLSKKYQASKVRADLDEAIDMLREAVTISPPGCPERAEWFTNLGNVMSDRYALTRLDEDLMESIQMLRKGLQAAPHHPAKDVWLNNLGLRLGEVYARSGAISDLEEAIEIARLSLAATAPGDLERANRLINLANRLCTRHLRTGAMADLEQGIAMFQQAIMDTPPDDRERAGRLNNLGTSLANKYLRTHRLADLEEAIKILREAVDISKMGPTRATCLSNLGNNLAYRYAVSESLENLEEAVTISRRAVDATPPGHHAMSERLSNVALRLRDKYSRTGQMADLDEAVRISQDALHVCPPDHPIIAACLDTVGVSLQERYRRTGRREDWEQARDCFASAVSVANSAVSVRVKAGRRFLSLAEIASEPEAYNVARSAINLIPLLTPRSLQNFDKRHLLSDAVGMASDAAAIALQAGQSAVVAIECLETGRGVIAGTLFEQHDISVLKRIRPDLAEAFVNLRDRLDQPAMQDVGSSIQPDNEDIDLNTLAEIEQSSRRETAENLDSLLTQIRSEAAFERYLLPASEAEMLDAARYGPIVIINVSSHRSDALIIKQSGIRSLPLPLVSPKRIDDYAIKIRSTRTLEWLWDAIVSPVLDALKLVAPVSASSLNAKWPRVWWIPTGKLTKFPLHAAGYHLGSHRDVAGANSRTALDRVISSYAASIKAIIQGRRQQQKPPRLLDEGPPKSVVGVSMRHTRGYISLTHAETEVDTVFQVLDKSMLQPIQPRAYKQDVLAAIANCEIFHFAGHGSTHPTEPLQSMLLLQDWYESPLTVSSLLEAEMGSSPPFLAYLSACGTSEIRSESSTDESLHLANACQLAGFRHVIGTIWSVADEICVEMARLVYGYLHNKGLNDEVVSWGLHHAARKLRDQWVQETMNSRAEYDKLLEKVMVHRSSVVIAGFSPGQPLWAPSNYCYSVRDVFVEATLVETYLAEAKVESEVVYVFEVPPEASVCKFSAQVGNILVEAIVDEKAAANSRYNEAKKANVKAWKLDKVNDELFQISLGNVSPNETITTRVTYVHIISSDTIEDSVRLTIPASYAADMSYQQTVRPKAFGQSAVTITVGIEVERGSQILGLNSLSHKADITNGFSDDSFKNLSPVEQRAEFKPERSYVEYKSDQFLSRHFVLVWSVPRIDQVRCIVETLKPQVPGKPATTAVALTLVSNLDLHVEEHEYIFLVDRSGSMIQSRTQAANDIIRLMMDQLPRVKGSSFNIYNFTTTASSILPDGRSLPYDTNSLATAVKSFPASGDGGTNINNALDTVLSQRDASKPRCSVILITDGLDIGVPAAMKTIQRNVIAAADQSKLLRVFVMGLGDDVSSGMCEALARVGSGATAYISESHLQEQDHRRKKAETMINSINRAPVRVRSIDWGLKIRSPQPTDASGGILNSRPQPNQAELGAAAKGDNLPPPKTIQQSPQSGTMFWAVRSTWYAIVDGGMQDLAKDRRAKIIYDIPGSGQLPKTISVNHGFGGSGSLIHKIAARALIQSLEDEAVSITDPTKKYRNECEIVRLGKTYGLASTQTSFVATMNGIGTRTTVDSNVPSDFQSLLSGVSLNKTSYGFVQPANSAETDGSGYVGSRGGDSPEPWSHRAVAVDASGVEGKDLSEILSSQDDNGAFGLSSIEQVFPDTGIPELPTAISDLQGGDDVKHQIWFAICVIAFLQERHADRRSEWSAARSKAETFVKTTLSSAFGVDSSQSDDIFSGSLDDAAEYFY
ncbi:von Willebrand factor A domain-containing protein [Trichoderma cornu-damae]|uniref:von Willebrand factor A domain-containing protein n=1 Tax=Trichoderma cornu-damae TaxID=654480 RepID=A0A9P8QG35_9HYPO|nr:von Willebrand factor A domain-containing protein [Trichoderma cornu-damae]